MSWVAVAVVGSAAVGGYMQYKGQKKAAQAQIGAADRASQAQLEMYYQSRADLAPWREAGEGALNELQKYIEDPSLVTEMPGYQFGLEQGTQAMERGAAARGKQLSGSQLNALQRYGQGYATTNWLNYLQPYQSMAGLGLTATGGTTQAGAVAAQGQSNALLSAMPAYGAKAYAPYGAMGSMLDWGGKNYLDYMMLKKMGAFGSGGSSTSTPWARTF